MAHTYAQLLYHIVFSTKERRPWLTPSIRPRVYEYLGGTIRGVGGVSLEIGGVDDHVHLYAKVPQTISIADFVRDIKVDP